MCYRVSCTRLEKARQTFGHTEIDLQKYNMKSAFCSTKVRKAQFSLLSEAVRKIAKKKVNLDAGPGSQNAHCPINRQGPLANNVDYLCPYLQSHIVGRTVPHPL